MQENIKNFTEIIAEDVRTNWVYLSKTWSNLPTLKTGSWWATEYFLSIDWNSKISDYSDCKDIKKRCFLVRQKKWETLEALVSSHIAFENLSFDISWTENDIPKVTMHFTVRPATWKWLSSEKIKNAKIIMQTTFSERLYKYK
jgi:hypothetical protein